MLITNFKGPKYLNSENNVDPRAYECLRPSTSSIKINNNSSNGGKEKEKIKLNLLSTFKPQNDANAKKSPVFRVHNKMSKLRHSRNTSLSPVSQKEVELPTHAPNNSQLNDMNAAASFSKNHAGTTNVFSEELQGTKMS